MQVRLLGPLDVVVDTVVQPVRGLRRRAVLAVLSLTPGETVSIDRLAATQTGAGDVTGALLDSVVGMLAREGVYAAERLPYAMVYLRNMIGAQADALSFQDGYLALAVAFAVATGFALTSQLGGCSTTRSTPAASMSRSSSSLV